MKRHVSSYQEYEEYEQDIEMLSDNCEEESVLPKRVRNRAYRRDQRRRVIVHLIRMDRYGEAQRPCRNRFVPYVDDDDLPNLSKNYIRYGYAPRKQTLKKEARRMLRRNKQTYFPKGNGYRRTYDYWWDLD